MEELVLKEAVVSRAGAGGIEITEREDQDAAIYLTDDDVSELLDWLIREYEQALPRITWYRSILPDGTLWLESSNLKEVLAQSEGMEYTLYRLQSFELWTDWEEFDGGV